MYKFSFKKDTHQDLINTLSICFEDFHQRNINSLNNSILIHNYRLGKILKENLDQDNKKNINYLSNIIVSEFDSSYTSKMVKMCIKFYEMFDDESKINYGLSWPYYVFILDLDDIDMRLRLLKECVDNSLSLHQLKVKIKEVKK